MNVSLVAISPQLPDETLSTAEKNALDFDVLSDVGNRVARQFGLVFELPEYVRSLYMGYGANLPKVNGDDSFELPMTAVYVLDRTGVVRHACSTPTPTNVPPPRRLSPPPNRSPR